MTVGGLTDAKARKRKPSDAPSKVLRFANLSHQNNTLKKQRRENDQIPAAQSLSLRSLSTTATAPDTNAFTSNNANMMDVDSEPLRLHVPQIVSPEEGAATLAQNYKQHGKPPGFIPLTCPYWSNRQQCPKDTGCFFHHSSGVRTASPALWQQAETESRNEGKFSAKFGFFRDDVVCPHWRKGGCHHTDEDCWYAHWQPHDDITKQFSGSQVPKAVIDNKQPMPLICYYWALGCCKLPNEKCKFGHHLDGVVAVPLPLQQKFPDWRNSLRNPTVEEFRSAKVAGKPYDAFLKTQGPPVHSDIDWSDDALAEITRPVDGSVHPDRLALLSAFVDRAPAKPKVAHPDMTVTKRMNITIFAHKLTVEWSVPSRIYDIYAQGEDSHKIVAVSDTDLRNYNALQEPLHSGRLTILEGDTSRFDDLFFWMKMKSAAIWMPMQSSTIGILLIIGQQKCWEHLPIVSGKHSNEDREADLLFYVYKQDLVQSATLLDVPEQLAIMDTSLGQLKSLIPEGLGVTDFFLEGSCDKEKKVVFVGGQDSEWTMLIQRVFEKAGFRVFFDFVDFFKDTSQTHSGVILIDPSQPIEAIRHVKGFCYSVHPAAKYNIFTMGSTDRSAEQLQCKKWSKSGMMVSFTAECMIQDTAAALDAIEQLRNMNKINKGQPRKIVLPCPILPLFSALLQHAKSNRGQQQDQQGFAPPSVKKLHETLTHFEDGTAYYDTEKPLIINPRGDNAFMIDDETTIAQFCQNALQTLQTYRQAIVVCAKEQIGQSNIASLAEKNQHVRFYTAEEFAEKLREW